MVMLGGVSRLYFGAWMAFVWASMPASAENVVFTLSYVDEIQQTSPTVTSYTVDQHLTVTLHDNNKVTEQRNWKAPTDSASIGVNAAFGMKVPEGKFSVTWKVESQNSLIRYREFPQHIEILHIKVVSKNCEATVTHSLKKGFSEYERFNSKWQPTYYSALRSSGIICRVEAG